MTIINPYREAASDQRVVRRNQVRRSAFCCKCSQEKPLFGGKFPGHQGQFNGRMRFVCADCKEK